MKINNIKTSASDASKTSSNKFSNNTSSKKNVQFSAAGDSINESSFVS